MGSPVGSFKVSLLTHGIQFTSGCNILPGGEKYAVGNAQGEEGNYCASQRYKRKEVRNECVGT